MGIFASFQAGFLLVTNERLFLTLAAMGSLVGVCLFARFYGLALLLLLAPLAGFLYPHLAGPEVVWKEIMVVALTVSWVAGDLVIRRKGITSGPLGRPLSFFLWLVLIQFILGAAASLFQSLLGLRIIATYIPIYLVTMHLDLTKRRLSRLMVALLAMAVATAAFGIYQGQMSVAAVREMGWDYGRTQLGTVIAPLEEGASREGLRAFSTFPGPEYLGLYMVLMGLLAVALVPSARSLAAKAFLWGAAALMSLAVVYTLVRVEWAMLGMGLVFLAVLGRRPGLVGLLAVGLFAVLLLGPAQVRGRAALSFSEADWSYQHRLVYAWNAVFTDIASNPLRGWGLGTTTGRGVYRRLTGGATEYHGATGGSTDSGYANIALELGLPGLVAYLWLMSAVVVEGVRIYGRLSDPRLKGWAAGITCFAGTVLVANAVASIYDIFPAGNLYFWFLVGVLMSLPRLEQQEGPAKCASA